MRWSEAETLKFVRIYLRHEHLWNPFDSGYKCRNKRQEAYKDIISEFHLATGIQMDDVDLKVKIKNLRSTYTQEVAKIRQRSGPGFVYTPSIKWFSEWHRCFTSVKERMNGSFDLAESMENSSQHIWPQQNDFSDKLPPLAIESDDCLYLKMEAHDPSPERDPECDSYKVKRKRLKHINSSPTYQSADSTVTEDEFDIYGKYIATQLRSMELHRALRVQLDIHNIVSEARMSSLPENSI